MQIKEITKNILEARKAEDELKQHLKGITAKKNEFQAQLIEELKKEGGKSFKTDEANFAITTKKDIRITNEVALIKELKNREMDDYVIEKVDTVGVKKILNKIFKDTDELFDGTEPVQSEYLTVKVNK